MTKQFFLRLVMAFGLMFGLHFSTPTLARVEGGEEPPIKLINARAEMGCHYPSCLHTDFSGDLQTTGSQSVLNATVKANLYNNGQLISSGLFNTQLPATIPGQLNHVSGIFDGVLYYQFTYTVEASINNYTITDSKYGIVDVVFTPSTTWWGYPEGHVYNSYPLTMTDIYIDYSVGGCYAYSMSQLRLGKPLPPGETRNFTAQSCYAIGPHSAQLLVGQARLGENQSSFEEFNICQYQSCLFLPMLFRDNPLQQPSLAQVVYQWGSKPIASDNYTFVAYVKTFQPHPVRNVSVQASIYDLTGTLLSTRIFTPAFADTLPGQFNPVQGSFDVPFDQVRRLETKILGAETRDSSPWVSVFARDSYPYSLYNRYPTTLTNISLEYYLTCGSSPDPSSWSPAPLGVFSHTIPNLSSNETLPFTMSVPLVPGADSCSPSFIAGQGQLEP